MRQRVLVCLVFGLWLCPISASAAEEPVSPADATLTSQRLLPVWRVLLLAYRHVDVDYTDDSGKQHHFSNKLSDGEFQAAVWSFRQYPSLAYKHSKGEVLIQCDIVYPARKINSVTKMGENVWWMSPNDTRPEINEHARKGTYDSILVLAPLSNHATGEHVPTGGWGLAIPPTNWSNGATYCTVGNAPVDMWNEPDVGEVWLHEWLHGASAHFAKKGWAMPKGDADAGGSHGYEHSSVDGWGEFYRDLMTGQVLDEGRRTGITKEAWQTGPIFGKKLLVAADYFSSDTRASCKTTGTVTWTGRGGKHENITLGGAQAGRSSLRWPVRLKNTCVVTARVQIPSLAVGMDDSVGIVVRDSYASLDYGTKRAGKTKMSIQSEQGNGTSSEVPFASGWYTVKVSVDPATGTISMKAWPDGGTEPSSWQVSGKLASRGTDPTVGLQSIGQGTLVDDLVIVEEP